MDWCLAHGKWSCPCCDGKPLPAAQAPDELLFMKSLARLAQMGDAAGCERLLEKRGRASDGAPEEGATGALTPLHYAARNGHAECVRILLAHQSAFAGRVNGSTRASKVTPLHRASYMGHLEVVALLYVIHFTSAADALTTSHPTPDLGALLGIRLKFALACLCLSSRFLNPPSNSLKHGADASMQDADGETAMHKASAMGHTETAKLLAERCPEAQHMRDRHGLRPCDRLCGPGDFNRQSQ